MTSVAAVLEAEAVMMAEDRRTFAVLGPVAAGRVAAGRREHAFRIRSRQHVVRIDAVSATADGRALLGECGRLGDLVRYRVEIIDACGDDDALGILPRALADAVARVDAGVASRCGRAQIGAPVGLGGSCRLGKGLAVGVGAGEAAEIGAITLADAGDEERHARLLRVNPGGHSNSDQCRRNPNPNCSFLHFKNSPMHS